MTFEKTDSSRRVRALGAVDLGRAPLFWVFLGYLGFGYQLREVFGFPFSYLFLPFINYLLLFTKLELDCGPPARLVILPCIRSL